MLAVVAGALREWLGGRDRLPERPLTAAVPVGTDRDDGPPRLHGNRVSTMFTTLATDVEDPVARLRKISEVTRESKQVQRLLGLDSCASGCSSRRPHPSAH